MNIDMAEVMKWLLVFLFALNALIVVSDIGKERKRYTPMLAARVIVVASLLIIGVVRYL